MSGRVRFDHGSTFGMPNHYLSVRSTSVSEREYTMAKKSKTVKMTAPKTKDTAADTPVRGRKPGTLGYRWTAKKFDESQWPSALEMNIIKAMQKVGDGTSGDVINQAVKTGLDELTKQTHIKVVNHVLGKMLKAGLVERTDAKATRVAEKPAKKATAKKTDGKPAPAKKAKKPATGTKKAKKVKVTMTPAEAPAADAPAQA